MTQTYKKKLIEVAIPLEAINAASAREKSIRHGHPSTLHLWWARRPLAACRAVLFAQLVDDPSSHPDKFPTDELVDAERKRLFSIIEELVVWENSTNEEVLERARTEIRNSCDGNLPPVYDPFSGGCSIPLEAQRLGLPAFGSDLNPVAVMIGKAMIEIPPKFKGLTPLHPGIKEMSFYRNAEGLAEDVKYYGEWMNEKAMERVGHLYSLTNDIIDKNNNNLTVIAWLWTRTVTCPNPGCQATMPLLSTFALSTKKNNQSYIFPVIKNEKINFQITSKFEHPILSAKEGYKRGKSGVFECAFCKNVTTRDYIAAEGQNKRIGKMQIAVVAEGVRGRVYLPKEASPIHDDELNPETGHLETSFSPNPRDVWCRNFGLTKPKDLFTNRQMMVLNTFSDLINEVRDEIKNNIEKSQVLKACEIPLAEGGTGSRAYSEAIGLYLSFAISRLADRGSTLCSWDSGYQKIRNTFGRQALPMTWDFAEGNPFSGSTGNWISCVGWIYKVIARLQSVTQGSEIQHDAQNVSYPAGTVISTDPPYYDNIGYADLSDFFFSLLRPLVKPIYPDIFNVLATPKADELIAAPYRQGGTKEAENYFLNGMRNVIKNITSQTSQNYPATIYYAFKQSEIKRDGVTSKGWATFLQAVIDAGYSVVGTWPIRTEMANRMVASGTNALANSVVMVCRIREANDETITRGEFIRLLKKTLPKSISDLQSANVSPADIPQSAIGPGIGIFSRYGSVLEANDDKMHVETALQVINNELDEFLNNLHGDLDAETRFAASWFEQNGYSRGEYGVADSLARARGIAVESAKHARIVESSAGKVRILRRDELDPDWEPNSDLRLTIWECCQHLIRKYEEGGETAAAMLVKKMGFEKAESVKDLAYYLYDICSNKRQDAKEATSYNALIAGWNDIMRMANSIHDTDTTRQASLF